MDYFELNGGRRRHSRSPRPPARAIDPASESSDNSEEEVFDEEPTEDTMADELAKKRDPRLFTCRVNPPAFSLAQDKEDFDAWLTSWRAFLTYSGIAALKADVGTAEEQTEKAAALKGIRHGALYAAMDKDTIRLVQSMDIEDPNDADSIITALEARTTGSTNTRVYRKLLFERKRRPEETGEEFVEAMRHLANRCGYTLPASREAYIAERMAEALVLNVGDQEIQERLLRLPTTTTPTEIAKEITTMLSARRGAQLLNGAGAEAARFDGGKTTGGQRGGTPHGGHGSNNRGGSQCTSCGRRHPKGACPAKGKECFKCHQVGHFGRHCKQTSQSERAAAINGEDEEGAAAASTMRGDTQGHMWSCQSYAQVVRMPRGDRQPDLLPPLKGTTVRVRPKNRTSVHNVKFLADTGANLTGIPPEMLPRMGITKRDLPKMASVNPPRQADGKPGALRPVGIFRAQLTWGNKSLWADIYIMQGLDRPLLSRQHACDLGIARVVTDDDLPK